MKGITKIEPSAAMKHVMRQRNYLQASLEMVRESLNEIQMLIELKRHPKVKKDLQGLCHFIDAVIKDMP
jgi:hypothetical protein